MADNDLGNYEISIRADVSQLEEAIKTSKEAKGSADELSGAYDKQARESAALKAATLKLQQSQSKLDDEFRSGKISATQYSQKLAILKTNYNSLGLASKKAAGFTNQLGWQMQNAGYQIGDFATQLAGGQNAALALAQQLPQLLGGMGVFGALAGAAAAVGGAFFMFSERAEESETAAREYRKEAELLSDALYNLNQQRREAAASDPVNLLGNIEQQRQALNDLISELTAVQEGRYGIDLVDPDPYATGVGARIDFQSENQRVLLGLLEQTSKTIRDMTGEEAELNETYGSRSGLLDGVSSLLQQALNASRELNSVEEEINNELEGNTEKRREAQAAAEKQLAVITEQLGAIDSGTSAIDAQAASQRELAIQRQVDKGVAEETAAALYDQAAALDAAVEKEKERLAAIQTNITAQQKQKDWLGDWIAEQDKAAQAEQARIDKANAGAELQLSALRAQVDAINGGASATEGAFIAQQKLYRAQLLSKGVAADMVDELVKLRGEINAAGQETGSEFADGFEQAGAQIAGSVTDALISGDWENTGEQIGAVLGAAIGAAVGGPVGMAIGSSIGGALFGGNDEPYVDPTAGRQASQNTGDVLGGIDDKAQSIADATSQTVDVLSDLVGVNRELLRVQQGADQSIGAFAAEVGAGLGAIGKMEEAFKRLNLPDYGVDFTSEGPEFYFSGKGASDIVPELLEELGLELPDLASPFQGAIDSVGEVLSESAAQLGIELSGEFSAALLDLGKVSLEDLSAEEFSQVISETFGTALNQASNQLVPDIQNFVDEVGESSGQVLLDFARNATVVTGSIGALNGSLSDLTGLEFGQAATDLVEVFGDSGAFASAMSGIFSTFATDEQQVAENAARLEREFARLGVTLPANRQGVLDLIDSLDLRNEADRETLEAIDRSTGALDDYYDTLEQGAEDAAQAAEDAFFGLQSATDAALSALRDSIQAQKETIRDSLADQLDALRDQRAAALEANKLQVDASKERVSLLSGELRDITRAYESMRGQSEALTEIDRQRGLTDLRSALASGNLAGAGDAAGAASQLNEGLFGSAQDFERERGKTLALLDQLNTDGSEQLTTAEQQLAAAEAQTDVLKNSFDDLMDDARDQSDAQLSALDDLYDEGVQQVNLLRGIDNTLLSISDALANLDLSVENERDTVYEQVRQAYEDILGRVDEGPGGVDFFANSVLSGERTIADVRADLAYARSQDVPAFANGGLHSGGIAMVGERGPELAMMGAARIVPNNSISDILGGMEIAELRNDMRAYFFELIKTDKQIRKQLAQWDVNGVLKREEAPVS